MMKYMLDTNMIAYAKNRRPACVLDQMLKHEPSEICISSITMAELEYGIFNSTKPAQNRNALMMFLSGIAVVPFDSSAALEYGEIRYNLKNQGIIIGGNDMLIAAHARSLDLILVTHSTKEFTRVPDLRLEDWAI